MITVTINDQEIEVEPHLTIMQACEDAGVQIPHFCYHPKLSIAGNCRMCLVEVGKSPKPVASCAAPIAEGMVIQTESEMAKKARKGVLEFLLINHPLDCPICDQGGECDLQDLTIKHGPGTSRFDLNKRAVTNKNMGPLVGTIMTRCIHCTRCVRFMNEVAGSPEIGGFGRGENMEISSYLEENLTSELSGNIIDLCPVGALTSKPYKFRGRPWELKKVNSIDILDAVGSNIRLDVRDREVMRILPRSNDSINEDWISDKIRFSYDGLKSQRLDRPYIRKNGKLKEASWSEAFDAIAEQFKKLNPTEIAAFAGDLVDCESTYMLKQLMKGLGVTQTDCRIDGEQFTHRGSYLFNTTIEGIEQADCILLVGTNPRLEAPLINARIYKRFLAGGLTVALIGQEADLTYPHENLGASTKTLKDIVDGSHPFSETWKKASHPIIILGQAIYARRDGLLAMNLAQRLCKTQDQYNILHTKGGRVGALDVGFLPEEGTHFKEILSHIQSGSIKAVYLHGVDNILNFPPDTFIIYQGHHGDIGAQAANVILPGCAFSEKTALYVNTEGRVQQANEAIASPGQAKEDWKIIRALGDVLKVSLPQNTRGDILSDLAKINPAFATIGEITKTPWKEITTSETLSHTPLESTISNFYMTDVITRHSQVMAECSLKKKEHTCQTC